MIRKFEQLLKWNIFKKTDRWKIENSNFRVHQVPVSDCWTKIHHPDARYKANSTQFKMDLWAHQDRMVCEFDLTEKLN